MIEKDKGGRPFGTFKHKPEDIAEEWNKYISYCERHTVEHPTGSGKVVSVLKPRIPTIGEFVSRLKISYTQWQRYTSDKESYKDFKETVDFINDVIESKKVAALVNGEGNTTGLIFDLKANYKWSDKQTIEHTGDSDNQLIVKVISGNKNE